jgi:hypothetical protein
MEEGLANERTFTTSQCLWILLVLCSIITDHTEACVCIVFCQCLLFGTQAKLIIEITRQYRFPATLMQNLQLLFL